MNKLPDHTASLQRDGKGTDKCPWHPINFILFSTSLVWSWWVAHGGCSLPMIHNWMICPQERNPLDGLHDGPIFGVLCFYFPKDLWIKSIGTIFSRGTKPRIHSLLFNSPFLVPPSVTLLNLRSLKLIPFSPDPWWTYRTILNLAVNVLQWLNISPTQKTPITYQGFSFLESHCYRLHE